MAKETKPTISANNKPSVILQSAKLPPQNIEAEQSLLGALLIDKDAIVSVGELLHPDDFYRSEQHGQIFSAIVELFEKREPIDLVTVTEILRQSELLDRVGGSAYLAELVNMVPTAAHVMSYARIVKEHSTRRKLISDATKFVEDAYNETKEIAEVIEECEQSIFAISQQNVKRDFIQIKDALMQSFDRLDELQRSSGKLRGVPTGFRDLDRKLAGMQDSNLIILAARPGMGKTSYALNIAQYVAVNVGLPVGIFSLEMSQEELVDRLLVGQADIDAWKLKTGNLDEKDFKKISDAMGILAEAPIYIDDTPGASLAEIRTKARRLQSEHGLKLAIVDYLQLIHGSGRYSENRVQEVSEISQGLKNLARELKIPVLALSQLSRQVENRTTRKPQLADLRESGCLAGGTLLMRADTGELVQIRDLVGQTNIPIYSLQKDFKLETKIISKVFSSGLKKLYELKTRSGRSIQASGNHPFLTVTGWCRADTLKIGNHVGMPRILPTFTTPTDLPEDELVLLAHLLGDGCVLPKQPIHYTSADPENIQAVAKAASRLFAIIPRLTQQNNWWHLYLPSPYRLTHNKHHPITNWFTKLEILPVRSYEKVIPQAVFLCSNERLSLFLHHLWSTDGNISWKNLAGRKPTGAIYYSSSSQVLANQIQHLLLRLGILSTVRRVSQKNYRPSFQVHIQGTEMQMKFCQLVGCFGKRGEIVPALLSALQQVTKNPNVDIIPQTVWKSHVESERQLAQMSWRLVASELQRSYCGSTLFQHGVSRERMLKVARVLQSMPLQQLAKSDVHWDEIVEITPLGVEEVFDATVPDNHNFIANDFIVHNSIEQDADVVMFIYREDPEAVEQVKLDIQKHRNGPTGEIELIFRGDRMKFYGMEKTRVKSSTAAVPEADPAIAA